MNNIYFIGITRVLLRFSIFIFGMWVSNNNALLAFCVYLIITDLLTIALKYSINQRMKKLANDMEQEILESILEDMKGSKTVKEVEDKVSKWESLD